MSTQGHGRLEAVQAGAEELLQFYKDLQNLTLPESIVAIGDETESLLDKYVPMLGPDVMKKWKIRGETIEDINAALNQMEIDVCRELTVSLQSILRKEIHSIIARLEWVAGHVAFITTSFIEFCNEFDNAVTVQFQKHPEQPRQILNTIAKFLELPAFFDGDENSAEHLGETGVALASILGESIGAGLVASLFEATIAAFAAAKFTVMTLPVLEANNVANKAIFNAALPQGTSRHRRKKLHRLRA